MNSSVLFPPNCQSLSDGVIRDVLLRAKSSSHSFDCTQSRSDTDTNAIHPGKAWSKNTSSSSEPVRHPDQPNSFTTQHEATFVESTPIESADVAVIDKKTKKAFVKAVSTLNRRRQQSRVNMARHRKKMQDHVRNMENSIETLREENHELEVRLHLLQYISTIQSTPWLVVSEYFRLFRLALTASSSTSLYNATVHRAFLQTTMAPDLALDSRYGPEALLDDYQRISTYHPDIDIRLVRLEKSSNNLMTATTQMKVSFTINTLQNAFPHLIKDSGLWKTIGSKLVGQQFVVNGFIHFRWDATANRVINLNYTADMMTPMLKLLGNLVDVARVFEFASYKPDCSLRPRQ